MQDFATFLQFLQNYFISRTLFYGQQFEKLKDLIVALLIVKRGKYSSSFINTSFVLLIITILIAGPAIAENNPFSTFEENNVYKSSTLAFDPYENALTTVVSAKPRDKVEEYTVVEGDTLASIADKFDVSIDTVLWANDLEEDDTINVGETLDIPPVTGVVHTVSSGDSIYSIAKKYNVDAQSIVNFPFNEFADTDTFLLSNGQVLYIPNGVVEAEQESVTTSPYIAKIQAGVRGTSNFIWPATGNITTYPVWYHMALDIANSSSPGILASDSGTVTYASCLAYGYGCHVIIDHGNGYETLYGHLSSIQVSSGQGIIQGQQLGIMGSTGRSTGIHLHFEIRSGGGLLNPLNLLQ